MEETSTKTSTEVAAPAEAPTDASAPATSPAAKDAPAATPARRPKRFARFWAVWRTGVGVWAGLFIAAAGFGLIAFTWSKVAALVNVALQIPYLMSGGLTGLGLIMLGLLVVNLALKRREALDRHRQLEEVREALVRLRRSIEGEPEEDE